MPPDKERRVRLRRVTQDSKKRLEMQFKPHSACSLNQMGDFGQMACPL